MVTTLDMKQKIGVIDNEENRLSVATAIANDIFDSYNLSRNYNLRTWLIDSIASDPLADIICNEQKLYIVELAKKCAADIAYIKHDSFDSDNFLTIVRGFGDIGAFIEKVYTEFELNFDDFVVTACETASTIGYEDTLLIDDTMYVYDNGTEDKIFVHVMYSIEYHPNYTAANLRHRIAKRLHYKWATDIKAIVVTENEDKTFSVYATFFAPKCDKDTLKDMVSHRFGASSGRPWYRCKVKEIGIGE
jgi:hypothetical protein